MPSALSPTPLAAAHARPRRAGLALGLAAAVLWLHGLLFGVLGPSLPPRPGQTAATPDRPPMLQVRTLAPAPRSANAAAALPSALPARTAQPWAPPSPAPSAMPSEEARPPAAAVDRPSRATAPEAAEAQAPVPGHAAAMAEMAGAAAPRQPQVPEAAPPPIYATRIPPSVVLRYALRYNGLAGEAGLAWRHDGQQYQLSLEGRGATQPLVMQSSRGGFDDAGLAPERFTDRRRGRSLQAASFRRDIGRIAFSGPVVDYPAWPGAQDRLSWLPQFIAIRLAADAARTDAPPAAIRLFVVDARGAGGLWDFEPDGAELLDTPMGPVATQRWRREPPRPEGLRVEAWLDAARGHWPAMLRFTALRSGDVFELRLLDEPTAPP